MKRYLILLLVGILGLLFFLSIFNWIINPYDLFLSPSINKLNTYKVSVVRHARLSKIYQIDRIKPNNILLASSKGMVVPTDSFSEATLLGYNSALLGATTYEMLRMMQHAQSETPLRRVILALDEEFTNGFQQEFVENRFAVNYDGSVNKNRFSMIAKDFAQSLIGLSAFRSSIRTIKMRKEDPVHIGEAQYQLNKIRKRNGHHHMFRSRESRVLSGSVGLPSDRCMQFNTGLDIKDTEGYKYFEDIIDMAYKNNIELYIYFSPVHARYYETMCMAGKWKEMEAMKRAVVHVVEKKAIEYSGSIYPIWDFSGYSFMTTEELPSYQNKNHMMKWYWDDSHYTINAARLIFDKIFSRSKVVMDIGVLVSSKNIDEHLLELRKDRASYIESHPEDIAELDEILRANNKQ